MMESAISKYFGLGFPNFVYSITKEGSLSSKNFKTTAFAFSPLGILIPQSFLADVAAMYSGSNLKILKHIQETMPLKAERVERVLAEEKPDLKDCKDFSIYILLIL